jgi:hypothetical protein
MRLAPLSRPRRKVAVTRREDKLWHIVAGIVIIAAPVAAAVLAVTNARLTI